MEEPMISLSPLARISALLLGLVTVGALMLQYALMVGTFAADGKSPLAALWRFLGYFTLLTNSWVALMMLATATGRSISARWMTAVTLAILLVGIVYHVLLAHLYDPVGWNMVADQLVHTVVPAAMLAWWLAFVDRAALKARDVGVFIAWPMAYTVYVLLRGATDGWYPYFFMDVPALGLPRVLLNVVGLGTVFAITGLGFVALGRTRRRKISA